MSFMATFNISKIRQAIITIIWGIIYASTDEFHQTFIAGRNGSVLDVLLDTSGVIFGVVIVSCMIYIYNKKIKSKNKVEDSH